MRMCDYHPGSRLSAAPPTPRLALTAPVQYRLRGVRDSAAVNAAQAVRRNGQREQALSLSFRAHRDSREGHRIVAGTRDG